MAPSAPHRLADHWAGRPRAGHHETATGDERGLALLDVLLGMAIFALIISIAMQTFGQYRERAFEATALSDLNALTTELEAQFTDTERYPAVIAITSDYAFTADGVVMAAKVSRNIAFPPTASSAYVLDAAAGTYTICLQHTSGTNPDAWAAFDSRTGQTTSGRGAGCPVP